MRSSADRDSLLQVFNLIPGTPANLRVYVSWYSRARQAGVFLPEHTSGAGRVDVDAGATLFISGEAIAVY